MQTDRFDLPLSAASPVAAAAYVEGVDLLLSANDGAEARLDAAIAADPDFALAHTARARLLQTQARGPDAKAAVERARTLAPRLSPRERRHVETIGLAVDGLGARAYALLLEHVAEFPRDAVVLSLALGVYGLLGFSGRRDHHEVQRELLDELAPRWDEDWWFLTYRGWAHIETGDVSGGTALVERALDGNPRNAHAAHARAHGYYEADDAAGGTRFLAGWIPDYARAAQLHGHLSWHAALFELALGNREAARAIYLDAIRPAVNRAPPMPILADAASFLWRWDLLTDDRAARDWREIAEHAERCFPRAGLPFADLHAALASAASGGDCETRIAELRALQRESRLPQGEVVPLLCAASAAFARGEDLRAATLLETALPELDRVGGSHAQRDVFVETLAAALRRSGRGARADALLAQRRKPVSRPG